MATYLTLNTLYSMITEENKPLIDLIEQNQEAHNVAKETLTLLAEARECLPVIRSKAPLMAFKACLAQKIHEKALEALNIAKENCPETSLEATELSLEELEEKNKLTYYTMDYNYQKMNELVKRAPPDVTSPNTQSKFIALSSQTNELNDSYKNQHKELEVYRKMEWEWKARKQLAEAIYALEQAQGHKAPLNPTDPHWASKDWWE